MNISRLIDQTDAWECIITICRGLVFKTEWNFRPRFHDDVYLDDTLCIDLSQCAPPRTDLPFICISASKNSKQTLIQINAVNDNNNFYYDKKFRSVSSAIKTVNKLIQTIELINVVEK